MSDKIWTLYQDRQPTEAGPYWWRIKSATLEGVTLNFVAHMRMRGTCGKDILSPTFDHWTGWQVQVPECEWSSYEGEPTGKIEYEHLSIEGLSLSPCPFCGKIPTLKAWQACSGGGFIIGPSPQNYNLWQLKCCAWGSTPDGKDPRKLEQTRIAAFSRVAASHIKPLEDALDGLMHENTELQCQVADAKGRERVLVEALRQGLDALEITHARSAYQDQVIYNIHAALASVREKSCQK